MDLPSNKNQAFCFFLDTRCIYTLCSVHTLYPMQCTYLMYIYHMQCIYISYAVYIPYVSYAVYIPYVYISYAVYIPYVHPSKFQKPNTTLINYISFILDLSINQVRYNISLESVFICLSIDALFVRIVSLERMQDE